MTLTISHVFSQRLSEYHPRNIEKKGLQKKITVSRADNEKTFNVDEILVAAGKEPNVDIGLENAGVKYTAKGVETNDHLQTNVKHIFAAGDVTGRDRVTHTALLESQVVANNMFNREKITPDYSATPEILFIHPSVATVGLSEDDCNKRDLNINKSVAPLNIIARSNTSDFQDGFVKIITNKKGVILGATIVAPHAGEIIHELALAVKYGLTAAQVAATPHAFLSWSEAVRVAASKLS